MSRFVRLRDAIEYCRRHDIDMTQFSRPEDIIGECVTCGAVKSWIRMDAGHYKSRGLGGGSGVYFDQRNVFLQCKRCNAFEGGRPQKMKEHIISKYGVKAIGELERKDRIPLNTRPLAMLAMERFYKEKYEALIKSI